MVAQIAPEMSLDRDYTEGPLVIPDYERQTLEIHRDKVRVGRLGGKASFAAMMPLDYSSSDVWDVYMNGFSATGRVYEPVADAGAQLGKNSVTIDVSRGFMAADLLAPWEMLRAQEYQKRSVSAVLDHLQKVHGVKYFNLKTHSMSGRSGVELGHDEPERINGVSLVSVAGLEAHDLWMMLKQRLPEFFREDAAPNLELLRETFEDEVALAIDYLWHNLSNPLRTLVEGVSVAGADIRGPVKLLKQKDVKVSIVDMENDRLIPNKGISGEFSPHVDYVGVHPNPLLGHIAHQTHPYEVAAELHRIDRLIDPTVVRIPRELGAISLAQARRERQAMSQVPVFRLGEAS